MPRQRTILVTNVTAYAGPGIVQQVLAEGHHVLCHGFADRDSAMAYERAHPGTTALSAQDPDALIAEAYRHVPVLDGCVFNDVHPIAAQPIEEIPLAEFETTIAALLTFPFRLSQAILPAFKAAQAGSIVFITSARERRPEPGYALPTAIRAGTTAFAKALAIEAAPFNIQVNVVAPNYLESALYYPPERFVDDLEGRTLIAKTVPMGRLGRAGEIGALVAFLVGGTSPFTTGQVIGFTGGWA